MKADSNRSQPLLKCGVCGRDCKNKFLLKQHTLKGNCKSVPYFRCAVCGTCLNTRSDLRRHLSRLHKNVKASQVDDYIIEVEPTFACRKDLVNLQKHKKKKHDGKSWFLNSTINWGSLYPCFKKRDKFYLCHIERRELCCIFEHEKWQRMLKILLKIRLSRKFWL